MIKDSRPTIRAPFVALPSTLKLYFYTSNEHKFSQAFAFLQRFGIILRSFGTRGDPYDEDYERGKLSLLHRAIDEILLTVGSGSLFFVEDTSLRIEALSTPKEDVPGLTVKEWFASASFHELDSKLLNAGNDRRARVDSDIALHIPGMSCPVFFHGSTEGVVASSEPFVPIEHSLPWLSTNSFNRWFIPNGSDRVLGAMSFEQSLDFDFRIRALRRMVERLEEYTLILNLPVTAYSRRRTTHVDSQLPLLPIFNESPIYLVIGLPCSGKTTFGEYVSRRFGYTFVEASSVMRSFRNEFEQAVNGTVDDYDFAKHVLKEEGGDAVARRIVEWYGREFDRPMVITGFRTIEELECIQKFAPATKIVLIEANQRLRYQRSLNRARRGERLGFPEFAARDKAQKDLGLLSIADEFANVVIRNVGGLEDFLSQIDSVILSSHNALEEGASQYQDTFDSRNRNQLYRCLIVLNQAEKPLSTAEIQELTMQMGNPVRANNANKILKRYPGLARRIESGTSRIRYQITRSGRSYIRKVTSNLSKDGNDERQFFA